MSDSVFDVKQSTKTTQRSAAKFETAKGVVLQDNRTNAVVQRVLVQDSRDARTYETDNMSDQEIIGLALQFFQLHNMGELLKIQRAHPTLPISNEQLHELAYGHEEPRTRKRHHLSDGESDSELPDTAFRSLRDEEDPLEAGLLPPVGHNPSITATAHVTAGSRATEKSRFISASRSRKVAGAWASKNKGGRVAKFNIPQSAGALDLTQTRDQMQVFPKGVGSSLNTAKASQEVLVPDSVPSSHIEALYDAEPLTVTEYERRKTDPRHAAEILARSRTKTTDRPQPFALHEVYNREAESERRLGIARQFWDQQIAAVVHQVNNEKAMDDEFTDIDAEDATEAVSELTENPHELDYIENEAELQRYLQEMRQAFQAYYRSF